MYFSICFHQTNWLCLSQRLLNFTLSVLILSCSLISSSVCPVCTANSGMSIEVPQFSMITVQNTIHFTIPTAIQCLLYSNVVKTFLVKNLWVYRSSQRLYFNLWVFSSKFVKFNCSTLTWKPGVKKNGRFIARYFVYFADLCLVWIILSSIYHITKTVYHVIWTAGMLIALITCNFFFKFYIIYLILQLKGNKWVQLCISFSTTIKLFISG